MEKQNEFSFRSLQYLPIANNWKTEMENFDIDSKFLYLLFEDYFVNLHSWYFTTKLNHIEGMLNCPMQEGIRLKKETEGYSDVEPVVFFHS